MAIKPPVHRLTKQDIIWLNTNYCRHSHTYLSHYNCYLKEVPDGQENIGFLDVETSNLKANFGIILSYCIKKKGDRNILGRNITREELDKGLDRRIVEDCVRDIKTFNKIITYYGSRFDLPFIRTRAAYHNIPFPEYGTINQVDLYYTVRNKFALHSNRLDVACKVITGKSNKTRIDSEHWINALRGDKKALEYVFQHNKYDVLDLERLYNKIMVYRKKIDLSI